MYQIVHNKDTINSGIVLKRVVVDGKIGLKLLSEPDGNHPIIGDGSLDLSIQTQANNTLQAGDFSVMLGINTIATNYAQTAIGKNNENRTDALFEIGNGSSSFSKSNALTVLKDGKTEVAGDFYSIGQITSGTSLKAGIGASGSSVLGFTNTAGTISLPSIFWNNVDKEIQIDDDNGTNQTVLHTGNVSLVSGDFLKKDGSVNIDQSFTPLQDDNIVNKKYVDGNPIIEAGQTSFTPDFVSRKYFEYTLSQNANIVNPQTLKIGQKGNISIIENSTGGYDVTWDTNYIFPNGYPTLDTDPNKINLFEYTVVSSDKIYVEFKATL
jgi:hypothetical protein